METHAIKPLRANRVQTERDAHGASSAPPSTPASWSAAPASWSAALLGALRDAREIFAAPVQPRDR